jgi:tetratricopeptide (TPR) repeat protein
MKMGSYGYALQDFEFILRYFPNHPRALALISELCDVKWQDLRCDSKTWFKKAIEVNPRASQTFLINGVHLHRLKQLPQAVESYKRAIELDPSSGNAHYNLALIYLEQGQYEPANRHAQFAYALGMPFPGLRDKLTKAQQWKPMDPEQIKRELGAPANAR